MAETNAATPPATSGGLNEQQVRDIIAAANRPLIEAMTSLSQSQKTIADTLATQQQAAGGTKKDDAAAGAGAGKPLSAEEVTRIVTDAIKTSQQQQQQTQQQQQARNDFVATRLKNFPAAYQARLGSDPAKWEQQAKQIQDEFKADLGKLGAKIPDVGGENPGGASPAAAAPDLSKLSPQQLAELGLQQSKPVTGTAVNTTADAAATAAAGGAVK